MQNLTDFERVVLNNIAYHEMNASNGAKPQSHTDVRTWSWADDFAADAMTVPQCKGVMSSLVKKGLIWCEGGGEDATCGFTAAGFEAFKLCDDNRSN